MSCVVFTLQKFLIVIISIRLRFELCAEIDSAGWPGGITEGRNTQTEVPHRRKVNRSIRVLSRKRSHVPPAQQSLKLRIQSLRRHFLPSAALRAGTNLTSSLRSLTRLF